MNAQEYILIKIADDNSGVLTGTMLGGIGLAGSLGAMGYGHHQISEGHKGIYGSNNNLSLKDTVMHTNNYSDVNNIMSGAKKTITNNAMSSVNSFSATPPKPNTNIVNGNEHINQAMNTAKVNAEKMATGSKWMKHGKIGALLSGGMMLGSMLSGGGHLSGQNNTIIQS